jgi:copper chaperone CopZ
LGYPFNVQILGEIMIKLLILTILSVNFIYSDEDQHMHQHSHNHDVYVQGEKLEVDEKRFKKFLDGLSDSQVAVVNVNGMVCDFCARGIEKTFVKDSAVKRVDVDLERGKVLIAYTKEKEINFDEIKNKILANGQNAIDFTILNI